MTDPACWVLYGVLVFLWTGGTPLCQGKMVTGVMSTQEAKESDGLYLTGFFFYGATAEIEYSVNATPSGGASFYLYLDEDWQEAKETTDCRHKLQMARIVHELENTTGVKQVQHFVRPRLWHVVYADSFTCDSGRPIQPLESPVYLQYRLQLFNPDSLGNPTEHFGGDEIGLLRFYQILVLAYFVIACIYVPRIHETLQKQGPMQLVIWLLSAATCLQSLGSLFMLFHLRNYSIDGQGSWYLELLAELFDLTSQFVMLYMLVTLSLGWSLGHSYKPTNTISTNTISKLKEKPAVKVVIAIGVLQSLLFLYEQYEEQREQRYYHIHRSIPTISLALIRIALAAAFISHLRQTISSERSMLKRDFYNSFTKCCMVWFLCYPLLVLISLLLSQYLRCKFITWGVVLAQCTAVFMLYRLFLSRSLYWEVSALSSYLPLRMDKTFGLKQYS